MDSACVPVCINWIVPAFIVPPELMLLVVRFSGMFGLANVNDAAWIAIEPAEEESTSMVLPPI